MEGERDTLTEREKGRRACKCQECNDRCNVSAAERLRDFMIKSH